MAATWRGSLGNGSDPPREPPPLWQPPKKLARVHAHHQHVAAAGSNQCLAVVRGQPQALGLAAQAGERGWAAVQHTALMAPHLSCTAIITCV